MAGGFPARVAEYCVADCWQEDFQPACRNAGQGMSGVKTLCWQDAGKGISATWEARPPTGIPPAVRWEDAGSMLAHVFAESSQSPGRMCAKCRQDVGGMLAHVGRKLEECWQKAGRMSARCWQTAGRMFAGSWQDAGRTSAHVYRKPAESVQNAGTMPAERRHVLAGRSAGRMLAERWQMFAGSCQNAGRKLAKCRQDVGHRFPGHAQRRRPPRPS
eukprot:gene17907-biopygen8109